MQTIRNLNSEWAFNCEEYQLQPKAYHAYGHDVLSHLQFIHEMSHKLILPLLRCISIYRTNIPESKIDKLVSKVTESPESKT